MHLNLIILMPIMLPFEAPTIFEQLPRFIFKMPRVVQDQKAKFESDELFRRLSRESEVSLITINCVETWKDFVSSIICNYLYV